MNKKIKSFKEQCHPETESGALEWPLGKTEGLLETVGFKKMTENVCDDEQRQIPEGSEFQTDGVSEAEPTGGKGCMDVAWTQGNTNYFNRLLLHILLQLLLVVQEVYYTWTF